MQDCTALRYSEHHSRSQMLTLVPVSEYCCCTSALASGRFGQPAQPPTPNVVHNRLCCCCSCRLCLRCRTCCIVGGLKLRCFVDGLPRERRFTDLLHDIPRGVRRALGLGSLRQLLHLGWIGQPLCDFLAHGLWVAVGAEGAEASIDDEVDVAFLLARQEGGEHDGQGESCCFRDRARSCLRYQDVARNHVLCHVGDETQTDDVNETG
mmetsp:Transcript_7507/g.20286  ORF Transcript_7507/g.20286 Transcript_7507/m.20286 type:complete len:208 (-) Transcript_7507:403-1026(-)